MKIKLFLCIYLNLLLLLSVEMKGATSSDSLISIVDMVVDNKYSYQQRRLLELKKLHQKADILLPGQEKFNILKELMEEYMYFSTDSAYIILNEMEDLANELENKGLIEYTKMSRANLLTQVAMYPEAIDVLRSLNKNLIADSLLSTLYNINRTLYGRLSDFALYPSDKAKYDELTSLYLDSLILINKRGSLTYTLALSDKYNMKHQPELAIKEINNYLDNHPTTEHEKAILYWTRSESYRLLGDKEARRSDIIKASISDLKSGVREYISLRELAFIMDEENDSERAYKYVTNAMQDAEASNARQRIIELNSKYPLINEIYIEKIDDQKKILSWTIAIISFLSIILFILFLFVKKEVNLVKQSQKKLQTAYEELDQANAKLSDFNNQLIAANKEIAEYSKLKEVYISKYMDQCMVYIDKIDSFRKNSLNLINLNKINELKKIVKSTADINEQLRSFYEQFDYTFLSLFPNFVNQVNTLLADDEKIEISGEERLNPELRILALIRLGVTDSDRIAKFLHYSLTTIYSYRTRLRNKAKGDRNKFEAEIRNINRET